MSFTGMPQMHFYRVLVAKPSAHRRFQIKMIALIGQHYMASFGSSARRPGFASTGCFRLLTSLAARFARCTPPHIASPHLINFPAALSVATPNLAALIPGPERRYAGAAIIALPPHG
jgi:hypothetical protein